MGYMQEFERELRELIDATQPYASDSEEVERLVRFVKEKQLESYRNGQSAGPSRQVGNAPSRNGTNARPARPTRTVSRDRR